MEAMNLYGSLLGGLFSAPSILIIGIIASLYPLIVNAIDKGHSNDKVLQGSGQRLILNSCFFIFITSIIFQIFAISLDADFLGKMAIKIPAIHNLINSVLSIVILIGIYDIIKSYKNQ